MFIVYIKLNFISQWCNKNFELKKNHKNQNNKNLQSIVHYSVIQTLKKFIDIQKENFFIANKIHPGFFLL